MGKPEAETKAMQGKAMQGNAPPTQTKHRILSS
jgi:hypothetical protein